MKDILSALNWKKYYLGLAILFCAVILCALAAYFYISMNEELRLSRQRLSQQVSQLEYAQEKMTLYDEIVPEFTRFQKGGLIGNTKRLQWLETAQVVGEKYDIPRFQYTLQNARTTQDSHDHYWHPSIRLDVARMELQMTLVHEGDWFAVMRYLRSYAKGLFSVEKCTIKLTDERDGDIFKGMTSDCLLDWFTLADITAAWEGQE